MPKREVHNEGNARMDSIAMTLGNLTEEAMA